MRMMSCSWSNFLARVAVEKTSGKAVAEAAIDAVLRLLRKIPAELE